MTNFLNYIHWEHKHNKVRKIWDRISPTCKAHFPVGYQLQHDNHLSTQNIEAVYSNLMKSIGGKPLQSH